MEFEAIPPLLKTFGYLEGEMPDGDDPCCRRIGLSCSIKKLGASYQGGRPVCGPDAHGINGVPVINGCSTASLAVILRDGSSCSMRRSRSAPSNPTRSTTRCCSSHASNPPSTIPLSTVADSRSARSRFSNVPSCVIDLKFGYDGQDGNSPPRRAVRLLGGCGKDLLRFPFRTLLLMLGSSNVSSDSLRRLRRPPSMVAVTSGSAGEMARLLPPRGEWLPPDGALAGGCG